MLLVARVSPNCILELSVLGFLAIRILGIIFEWVKKSVIFLGSSHQGKHSLYNS